MKQYLFTPGPVPMSNKILEIGREQVPYFRNEYFSNLMLESKELLIKLVNAPKNSEVIFLTSSGTGAMEATIINLLNCNSHPIVINGGGFGQRFVDICNKNNIPHHNIQITKDEDIDFKFLSTLDADSFIVNAHETTVGRLYDLNQISKFTKENNLINIVDGISTIVCDELDMIKHNIDALILSSNKGLALPPGLGMVVLGPKAIKKLKIHNSIYFDFKDCISNMKRGQTPFTPAVSILKQLHFRLNKINTYGINNILKEKQDLALYFRDKIKSLPLALYLKKMPNGMTTLTPTDGKLAFEIVEYFEKEYNIILTPSGGELKDKVIRISHMGYMDTKYIDVLINHLNKYYGVSK